MSQPSPEFLDLQAALAGEYSLRRELGRGGMGIVFLARDVQLDRDVAIKVLPAHQAQSAESRERFVREARIAAGLSHPNIVPIHRVGEAGGFVFFVMSYVEGETLGERLRTRGPLPPADAMRVMREVAWALAYAHGRGIVHRDVKPDNILLESKTGRALVTDFGIARGDEQGKAADLGRIMGTAHFMSPEQASGLGVDGRSDIYALGVVGYLAVSGRLPFEAANLPALIVRQASARPTSVLHASPGLPPALGAVIDRCLSRDLEARFADAETLATALAPSTDPRPALPATLRAWLGARNHAIPVYAAWSAGAGLMAIANLIVMVQKGRLDDVGGMLSSLMMVGAPLLPMLGSQLTQARRLFRAGHTLDDLRFALDVAARERSEDESLADKESVGLMQKLLRQATYAAATWSAATAFLAFTRSSASAAVITPIVVTAALGVLCNALEVNLIPAVVRRTLQSGLRERLWKSRLGAWLARRLGAPGESRAIDGGVFRATEAALGIAASELFAALPKAYRDQLVDLPATVEALEARAAAARAEIDVLAVLAPSGVGAEVLEARRGTAAAQLARSVAALEGIRLDLLRLHADAGDLAPLTTLIDAARLLGEDVNRLVDATREANRAVAPRLPALRRVPTPA
jgi:serine/threonine-protein kinase